MRKKIHAQTGWIIVTKLVFPFFIFFSSLISLPHSPKGFEIIKEIISDIICILKASSFCIFEVSCLPLHPTEMVILFLSSVLLPPRSLLLSLWLPGLMSQIQLFPIKIYLGRSLTPFPKSSKLLLNSHFALCIMPIHMCIHKL